MSRAPQGGPHVVLPEWIMAVDLDLEAACEEDFNAWYDQVHLPEIVECEGFVAGTRFISPHTDLRGRRRHLTLYELEGPHAFHSPEFSEARGLGQFASYAAARTRIYRRHLELAKRGRLG